MPRVDKSDDLLEKSRGSNRWKRKREGEGGDKKEKIDPRKWRRLLREYGVSSAAEEHHLNHEWFINFTPGSQRSGGPRATRPEEPN